MKCVFFTRTKLIFTQRWRTYVNRWSSRVVSTLVQLLFSFLRSLCLLLAFFLSINLVLLHTHLYVQFTIDHLLPLCIFKQSSIHKNFVHLCHATRCVGRWALSSINLSLFLSFSLPYGAFWAKDCSMFTAPASIDVDVVAAAAVVVVLLLLASCFTASSKTVK